MAINYALKYAKQVDERFKKQSVTAPWTSGEYDFLGVKTVRVYNIPTAPLNDYVRTGDNRYGIPAELQDGYQEMTLTQDKSFSFTIDAGNNADQMGVKAAGTALKRQIDQVIVPELDKHRLATWAENAGQTVGSFDINAIEPEELVEYIMKAESDLTEYLVPEEGRVIFMPATVYNKLRLAPAYLNLEKLGTTALAKGVVGEIAGMKVVRVPNSYMPDTNFLTLHKSAVFAPTKLQEYKIHTNPPGINGVLVEGRVYHDAFVLEQKSDALCIASAT